MLCYMQQAPEDLIGTAEVIEQLDIDRSTLTRWVERGIAHPETKLPGRNGAYVFTRTEVERLRELRGDRKQMPRDVPVEAAS